LVQGYVSDGQDEEPEPGNNDVEEDSAVPDTPASATTDFARIYETMMRTMAGEIGDEDEDDDMPDILDDVDDDDTDESVPDLDDTSDW
jgi:hypothetical protein